MRDQPTTLGAALGQRGTRSVARGWLRAVAAWVLNFISLVLLVALLAVPIWWWVERPAVDDRIALGIAGLIFGFWLISRYQFRKVRRGSTRLMQQSVQHPLLAHDRQGFMAGLALAQKAAILDGSNLYHFGLKENLGPRGVQLLAQHLRADGYRVVCFFDANIHYRLIENGDAPNGQRHSVNTLTDRFGLRPDEVYVVPSKQQADKFILDTLKHLPLSFAVSNDRFRDYAKTYPTVMRGDQWRKGVTVTDTEIRIIKHRFTSPAYLS